MQNAPTLELHEPEQQQQSDLVRQQPSDLVRQQQSDLVERRRAGRIAFNNAALIELLRHPTAEPATAEPIDVAARPAARDEPVRHDDHHFTITDFDSVHPRPGDPRTASHSALPPPAVEFAVARAARYCRDDRYSSEWAGLLATEVGKIRSFIAGADYPTAPPTGASINALIGKLVAISGFLRRICLISGRDGTRKANREVAQAIGSLASWTKLPGEYAYWSELRPLCASLCFYWSVAGAIARHDFATARRFMHTSITRNGTEEMLVSALPLLALGSIEWKVLRGLEERRFPASDFMFSLFKAEVAEAALDPGEAVEDLCDRLEFMISLEFSHMRLTQIKTSSRPLWFWMPLGRYVCNLGGRLLDQLVALQDLPPDHALLQAGLLGGTPITAADAVRAMRQSLDTCHRRHASGVA